MISSTKIFNTVLDIIVPFGPFLRNVEGTKPFHNWNRLVLHIVPFTFFIYWLFSLIPVIGTIVYVLILVPLSARRHISIRNVTEGVESSKIYLWYFTVIVIGFGGLWSFIGHTFMADYVAEQIGWATGSPFQIELAFYTLGSAIVALMAVWIRGHMITALVISKSIFWFGAGGVHVHDAIVHQNYSPLNIGAPLIGDIVFPIILLFLLYRILKVEIN